MNKPIVIVYLNSDDYSFDSIDQLSKNLIDFFKENNLIGLCIPTKDKATSVECINPTVVSEEEYKKAFNTIKDLELKLYGLQDNNQKSTIT